jgi:hypothetical protein
MSTKDSRFPMIIVSHAITYAELAPLLSLQVLDMRHTNRVYQSTDRNKHSLVAEWIECKNANGEME